MNPNAFQKSKPFLIYSLDSEHLEMRHSFIVVGYNPEVLHRWCCEQFGEMGASDSPWYSLGVEFFFQSEHDAFHFKMKWG